MSQCERTGENGKEEKYILVLRTKKVDLESMTMDGQTRT
jgi:hypothetical protein